MTLSISTDSQTLGHSFRRKVACENGQVAPVDDGGCEYVIVENQVLVYVAVVVADRHLQHGVGECILGWKGVSSKHCVEYLVLDVVAAVVEPHGHLEGDAGWCQAIINKFGALGDEVFENIDSGVVECRLNGRAVCVPGSELGPVESDQISASHKFWDGVDGFAIRAVRASANAFVVGC